MSLIFGRLGQSFIDFGISLQAMSSATPSPEQYASYQQAAENLKRETARNALWLVCIGQSFSQFATVPASLTFVLQGLGTWVTTYIYMATWALTGERNAKRIRENYLRAILRQDVAYFETSGGAGEVATRIQSDTRNYKLT
jgi:ATP-binding cassette subfamily B (MDR/TAP) protein 1